MHFQPLTTETLAATQSVAAELFPWEREHQLALAAAAAPGEHTGFLQAHGLASVRCWTAHFHSGPVCGIATLYGYEAQPDELWLAWFGLLPGVRGLGAGAKLLDWLIASTRAEHRQTLRLWTTDEAEYAAAMRLYQRRGFVVEDHPPLPGETWRTFVLSLGLEGRPAIPWSAVLNRGELCGREIPTVDAVAA